MSKTVDHVAYKVVLVCATQVVVDPSEGYKNQGFFGSPQIDGGNDNCQYADNEEATGLGTRNAACGKRP